MRGLCGELGLEEEADEVEEEGVDYVGVQVVLEAEVRVEQFGNGGEHWLSFGPLLCVYWLDHHAITFEVERVLDQAKLEQQHLQEEKQEGKVLARLEECYHQLTQYGLLGEVAGVGSLDVVEDTQRRIFRVHCGEEHARG